MSIYLAIDYGQVHLGLAYADHTLATPLPALKQSPQLFAELRAVLTQYHITHLIIGLPSGRLVPEINAFAARLRAETGLPVTLFDETLSTQEALSQLRASGASRRKRQHEHSYSAALILEDYLESATLNPSN